MAVTPVFGFYIMEIGATMNSLANDTPQKIEDAILGRKPKQTAKTDPTASGNAIDFLATFAQDADGVVTVTKKTIPAASSDGLGLIKIGYTQSGKNYPVALDANNKAYVYVPWSDTTYGNATQSAAGLMSAADKTKLDGVAAGATANVGTITGIRMNGASKGSSGVVDLGTVITSHQSLSGCVKNTGNESIAGVKTFTDTTDASGTTTGAVKISGGLGVAKKIYGSQVYNGVYNDYAECREAETVEPGRCITEGVGGVMELSFRRLMPACRIISDTYGSCMGETERAKTPVAVAGRVLAYVDDVVHIGDALCSGFNGTLSKMTREEIQKYPDRIVAIVSEIPDYEVWHGGTKEDPKDVLVNGRVWVNVR